MKREPDGGFSIKNERCDDDKLYTAKILLVYLQSTQIFPDCLNFYIEKSKLSQQDLARKINFDTSALSHWRKGRRIPDNSAIIFALANAMSLQDDGHARLLKSWCIQKQMLSLVDYVKSVIQSGTCSDTTLDYVMHISKSSADEMKSLGE